MARYKITVTVSDSRLQTVEKKLKDLYGEGTFINVAKINDSPSRADRLSEAEGHIDEAKSIIEELNDEMQNWLDGMPENLQSGSKADEIQECIDALGELTDQLDNADCSNISFPSMM